MAIEKTSIWQLRVDRDVALSGLWHGLAGMGAAPAYFDGNRYSFTATTPPVKHLTRFEARWRVSIEDDDGGSRASISVDMTGGDHRKLLDTLAVSVGSAVVTRSPLPSNWKAIKAAEDAKRAAKQADSGQTITSQTPPEENGVESQPPLDEAVSAYAYDRLKGRVKARLAANLLPDETIRVVIHGAFGQAMVGTDNRVFVCKPGFMAGASFGVEMTSWSYINLVGVQVHKGMASGSVVLQGPGQTGLQTSYWQHGKGDPAKAPNAIPFGDSTGIEAGAARLRQLIDSAHRPQGVPTAQPALPSVADEINKLAGLKAQGLLTDEEFAAAKTRLLSS
jgi:hypothetical protein